MTITRKFWVKCHRYVGLTIAGFLVLTGLTGSLLAFHKEIDRWLNPNLLTVAPQKAPFLTIEQLTERLKTQVPDATLTSVNYPQQEGLSVMVYLTADNWRALPGTQAYVNPYTGALLGARFPGQVRLDRAHFMPFIYRLHYTMQFPSLVAGKIILGVIAILWFLDCFVGFYITLPRKSVSFWPNWRRAFSIKWRAPFQRVNHDFHVAAGLWLWLLLGVMAFTCIKMNMNTLVFQPVVSLFSPVTPIASKVLPIRSDQRPPRLSFDQAVERGIQAHQQQRFAQNTPPLPLLAISYWERQGVYRIDFRHNKHIDAWFNLDYHTLYLDGETGKPILNRDYQQGTAGDQFLHWQYPLHSGQILGLTGRWVVCLMGIVVSLLSIGGVVIWARKRKRQGAKQTRTRERACPTRADSASLSTV